MPYQSKVAIEDERWMRVKEAIRHIMLVEQCTKWEARDQLRALIKDAPVTLRAQKPPPGSMPVSWDRRPAVPGQVLRFQIERTWLPKGVAEAKAKSTIADERKVEAWLTRRMKDAPNQPLSKEAIRQELQKCGMPTLGSRAFERVWTAAVKASNAAQWRAGGRRPKRRTIIDTPK